ncbi:tyrosine-type recombinase/integrase [Chromobacterium amazonense]|uniref:tyrosine-type recombinase/integrase n=1 Tax=Chromobacterium amazonense TaxID=1382803 RepID=UPI0031F6A444
MKFPALTVPIDNHISAENGWNRATGDALIDAESDVAAVMQWIKLSQVSAHTKASYQKEAERFLLWTTLKRGKKLTDLLPEDLVDYAAFLADPDPDWCGPTRPRHHPDWRPFAFWEKRQRTGASTGGLSPSSVKQARTILAAMFRFLTDSGYLRLNPMSILHKRQSIRRRVEHRVLDKATVQFVFKWLDSTVIENQAQQDRIERDRWVFALYYYSGARLTEATSAVMGSFHSRDGKWWLMLHGKGGKSEDVPVHPSLLEALKRYRSHLGLSPSPHASEITPLIVSLYGGRRGTFRALGRNACYKALKDMMHRAAEAAAHRGLDVVHGQLSNCSTHWLRHSTASHQLDAGVPLLMVSQNMRHSKIETTRIYLHTEDDNRHEKSSTWGVLPKCSSK